MPVPPLPLELVALIVDELAASCSEDQKQRLANGRNVALVCRSWSSLGTAVVWRNVVLHSPEELSSLLSHFERHPKLPLLLKELYLVEAEGAEEDDDSAATQEEALLVGSQVKELWTTCSNIQQLEVSTPPWLPAAALFDNLPLLKRLRQLDLTPEPGRAFYRKTPSLLSSLASLTSLRTLAIGASTATVFAS